MNIHLYLEIIFDWAFYGSSNRRKCGCGVVIVTKSSNFFHFWWEGGMGSNNKLEITTLWGVLITTKWLMLDKIQVYGVGKWIIHWVNKHTNFNPPILANWMMRIQNLIRTFNHIHFQQIYREWNWTTDLLSKRDISKETGKKNSQTSHRVSW